MARPNQRPDSSCPFIDRDDPRCAPRFTLSRLHEAFHYCLADYGDCPVYHQLSREQHDRDAEAIPQPITIFGRDVQRFVRQAQPAPAPIPFRQTGT